MRDPLAEVRQSDTPALYVARAPAKLILLGEHAVVYGRPAVAVPVHGLEVTATVRQLSGPMTIRSSIPGGAAEASTEVELQVRDAPDEDPLATAARVALASALNSSAAFPDWLIEIRSTIPIRKGFGSSAAVAVAIVRAVAGAAGVEQSPMELSALAHEAEKRTHGNPSGVDTAVAATGRPIYFQQGECRSLALPEPIELVVADSGERASTRELVAGVRERRGERPRVYERWFDQIGSLVDEARVSMEAGEPVRLGWLLDNNHLILQAMRLSTAEIDRLVAAARQSGALGAKLSGAGGGGLMVALAESGATETLSAALQSAGACDTVLTCVPASVGQ